MSWSRAALSKLGDAEVAAIADRVTQKFTKWRATFASWQLGTRSDRDGECRAVRDHRELSMLLRAEVSALTACLINAGVFTAREYTEQVIVEIEHLDESYSQRFPGFKSTEIGMSMSLPEAAETMAREGFPP